MTPPPAPQRTAAQRRADAYRMLGVAPNVVADAPRIAHLIAKIQGGRTAALEALRASDLPEARHFISKHDNLLLPSYVRRILPLEAFAVAAGLSPTRLFGVIVEVIRLQKSQLGAVKAAERHEEIVAVSSEAAMSPLGVEDRMAHLKHMGFTPSPKGSQINILTQVNATATADAKSLSAPSPEDTIRKMVEARQQQAQLAAGPIETVPTFMPAAGISSAPVPIEAEYLDDEGD